MQDNQARIVVDVVNGRHCKRLPHLSAPPPPMANTSINAHATHKKRFYRRLLPYFDTKRCLAFLLFALLFILLFLASNQQRTNMMSYFSLSFTTYASLVFVKAMPAGCPK